VSHLLTRRPSPLVGYRDLYPRAEAATRWLGFGLMALNAGQPAVTKETGEFEEALVVLTGTVSVTVDGTRWTRLGGRASVFDGLPTLVYVPLSSRYTVEVEGDAAEVAVCRARATRRLAPFVVPPEDVRREERGRDHWRREVRDILVAGYDDRVDRLVVGETINAPGEWSGYPPHKHDEAGPEETVFEEIYHYRVNPPGGFGIQVHYGTGREPEAWVVQDGDSYAIPNGYHPVVAAGGYQVYYLWCMAGPLGRTLKPYEDPQHRWVHHTAS
jgi:5-deoxy-glucuronate isomerase